MDVRLIMYQRMHVNAMMLVNYTMTVAQVRISVPAHVQQITAKKFKNRLCEFLYKW